MAYTSRVEFDEKEHRYSNNKNETYISASQLIHKYCNDFKEVETYWALYTVIRDHLEMDKAQFSSYLRKAYKFNYKAPKDIKQLFQIASDNLLSPEQALKQVNSRKVEWKETNKESTDKGSAFHNWIEDIQRVKGQYITDDNKKYNVLSHIKDFTYLEDTKFGLLVPETIPELRLYNHKYKIAGTSDQPLFEYPYVDINDWKTNKKIKYENKYDNMLHPVSHLQDCNFNHYQLQLSLYAWMLEQFGYKPRNIGITHILFDDNKNIIGREYHPMKYLKKEIELILEHYANSSC